MPPQGISRPLSSCTPPSPGSLLKAGLGCGHPEVGLVAWESEGAEGALRSLGPPSDPRSLSRSAVGSEPWAFEEGDLPASAYPQVPLAGRQAQVDPPSLWERRPSPITCEAPWLPPTGRSCRYS